MTMKTMARLGAWKYMQFDTKTDDSRDKSLSKYYKYSWKESLQQH